MTQFRALIVEPDALSGADLLVALGAIRIGASLAPDGAGAERFFETGTANLVFVSYEIEGGGLPLAARLRQVSGDRGAAASIVVVASHDGPALRAAGASVGIDGILVRPVKVPDVARTVEAILTAPPGHAAKKHQWPTR
jgi:DNA-binding response OmpR family regulator